MRWRAEPADEGAMVFLLEWVDVVLVLAGMLLLAVWLVRWQVTGGADPLRGAPLRPNRLSALLLWFCLLGYVVGGALGHTVVPWLVPETLPEDVRQAWQSVMAGMVVQVVVVAACLIVAHVAFMEGWRGWGLRIRSVRSEAAWALGGWLVALSLSGLVAWFTLLLIDVLWPQMERPSHGVFVTLSSPEAGVAIRAAVVCSAVLIAPVGEELFFRGILQTALVKVFPARPGSRYHRWCAIAMAGILFGLMHFTTPHYVPALIVLGVILGYLYERRGSLVVPVLIHMLFNAKSLMWHFLQFRGGGWF